MIRICFLALLFVLFLIIKSPMARGQRIDASYGAMIMAIGIFFIGVFPQLQIPFALPSYVVDISLFFIWLFLISSFMKAAAKGVFKKRYLTHPVQSFAVGTWVAATSILCLVLYHQFPALKWIIAGIIGFNTALWVFYIVLCIKSYRVILSAGYYERVHGVVFLSTVSTQSLIIVSNTLFSSPALQMVSRIVIGIGLLLYILNLVLFTIRLRGFQWRNLASNWKNTNCIVHGAMSISGMAAVVSGAFSSPVLIAMWLWAAVMFVLIESIELWRLFARLRAYTVQEAIGRYHVSQWARNFTFGTFFVFTLNMNFEHAPAVFSAAQDLIVSSGIPALILLLAIESMLFFKDALPWQESRRDAAQRLNRRTV